MSATVSQPELRNDSGAIMRRAEQGESFTVTGNGVPVADLLPHRAFGANGTQRLVPVAEIAPLNSTAARHRAGTAGRDPKPRRFDLVIAAVAVAADLPLITRNPSDFRNIHQALTIIPIG